MKRITFICTLFLLFAAGRGFAQNQPACTFVPQVPVEGQPLTIVYDNSATPLAGESTIEGVVYLWKNLHWEAEDLNLTRNDTAWQATLTLPEGVALLACKFYAGDKADAGGQATYATFTFDPEGRNLPTAYLAWGALRNPTLMTLPGYCDTTAYIADDVMLYWINQQLRFDPDARRYVFSYAARLLDKMAPGQGHEQMQADVEYILSLADADEPTLLQALEVARNILRDTTLSARVDSTLLARFPDGIRARDAEIWRLFRITDPEAKTVALDSFLLRFPMDKFRDVETETSNLYLAKIFQPAIYEPIVKRDDYSRLYAYLHTMPLSQLFTCYWHMVQIPLRNNQLPPEKVAPHAKALFDEIFARPRVGSEPVYSPRQWKRQLLVRGKDMVVAHASILDALGDSAQALELMEEVKDIFAFRSADYNDLYVRLLVKNGYDNMVVPTIETALREDAVTPAMLDLLRQDYVARHGTADGFDSHVASLKSPEQQQQLLQHLRETQINEDITLYTLRDLDGNEVNMADLRGKIIILDFWATWCAPCKASLPGMQMAVNKYADDPDVAFFFISTMETKKDYKDEIRAFLREKNFNLRVLCDNINPETGKPSAVYDAYAKAFHFSGIPHKMVIDARGKLRWNLTGYHGSPSALAEEISAMIEMLKAEE